MTSTPTLFSLTDSLNPQDMGEFFAALSFAAEKHRYQRRKDGQTPYINHPITLVQILWQEAAVYDLPTILGALLHDTVEDTDTTFDELEQEFGALVMTLVREVTDDKTLPKAQRKQLQIIHASQLSDRARCIKLADKTANLRDMVASPPLGWNLDQQQTYVNWAKTVIDEMRGSHSKLEELFDQAHDQALCQLALAISRDGNS
jgi:guanosine-3',5'-bis(diphosphate) 3'-pyrophosphohydrolase